MPLTANLDEMMEISREYDVGKKDFRRTPDKIYFGARVGGGHMELKRSGWKGRFYVEDNALQQFCARLGSAVFPEQGRRGLPYDFHRALRDRFPDDFGGLMATYLDNTPRGGDKWLLRTHNMDLRAVLSDRYAPIANTELLSMAGDVLKEAGQRDVHLLRPSIRRDDLTCRVILSHVRPDDGMGGMYGLGFMLRNNEVGRGALELLPLVQRTSCLNSVTTSNMQSEGMAGLRLVHLGNPEHKRALLASSIVEILPWAERILDRFIVARRQAVDDLAGVIDKLGAKYKWTEDVTDAIKVGTEGQHNLFGLVNGITYAAHQAVEDPAEQADMETIGGDLLFDVRELVRLVGRDTVDAWPYDVDAGAFV